MKKFAAVLTTVICLFVACAFGLTACGGEGTGVKLNKTQITLEIGDSETLTATVPSDGAVVTWSSDNSAVATVEDGKVTALAKGTAVITAFAEGKSATCTVTVVEKVLPVDPTPVDPTPVDPTPVDPVAVESVTLNKSTLTLDIGGTETLSATVKPDDATNKTVSWKSDKPEIANVDNGGKVTAKAAGTAIITATADGKSDACTVTVNPSAAVNKYAEIVTALQVEVDKKYDNAEILFIYEYNGYLACKIKTDDAVRGIRTMVATDGHSLTADIIDTAYYTENLKDKSLLQIPNQQLSLGLYTTDGTADDKQMVESMIAKLLGDGYTVIYGTISTTRDLGINSKLGNSAEFDVYALLEKDRSVFEYSETVTATKDLGDVYQTVLNRDKGDYTWIDNEKAPTDLGEVAALYLAECKKVQQANQN